MTYFTYSSNELLCSLILMSVFSMISSIALANWLQSASSVKMPFLLFIISIIPPEHFAPITGVLNNSASNMVDGNVSNLEHIRYTSAIAYNPES